MNETQSRPSPGFTELIGRALTDHDFRESLFQDRAKAVERYSLSSADLETLDNLQQETLEQHASQFGKVSATALEIGIVIRISF